MSRKCPSSEAYIVEPVTDSETIQNSSSRGPNLRPEALSANTPLQRYRSEGRLGKHPINSIYEKMQSTANIYTVM
jgi:hypothetical protein